MQIGGQAVMEGVMMRNQERFAVAVRTSKGKIKIKKEKSSRMPRFFKIFFVRGIVGLVYTLYDGIKALIWSANQQENSEEKLNKKEIIGTIALSFLASLLFFVVIPFFAAKLIHSEGIWFNVLDGFFRVIIFVGYLWIISSTKEGKRLFQYHGAEHKSISAYEAKDKLTVKNVRKYSRFHPRCGTSFIFIVLILSIIIFSFLEGAWYVKFFGRILLIPIIAGIGYELLKFGAKYQKNIILKIFIAPGLWLQRLTTKEPTDKQLEVGIKALESVVK